MLTSVFGISIKCEAWKHQDSLPVYSAGSYDFQRRIVMNNEMKPKSKLASDYQTTKTENQVRFLRYREGADVYGISPS